MGIKTAEGKQNFKSYLNFLNFQLSSPSGILPTLSALHAIRRFRLQFALKGIWLPFAMALKAISDPANALLFSRIFWILYAVANPFWQKLQGIWYLLELKQKGASNPFK